MASLHRIFQVPPGFEDDSPEACRLDRAIAEDRADALIRQAQATSKGSDALEHLIQLVTFERCSRSLVVTDFLRSLRHQGRFDLSLMFDLDEVSIYGYSKCLRVIIYRYAKDCPCPFAAPAGHC